MTNRFQRDFCESFAIADIKSKRQYSQAMSKQNTKSNKSIKLQTGLAIASFIVATFISCVSLWLVPPPDVISNSALVLTSDFLLLTAGLMGVDLALDYRLSKFKTSVMKSLENKNEQDDEQDEK